MTAEEALRILSRLADGIDPETGEMLARASVVQRPDVIRALHQALVMLRREAWREKRRGRLPPHTGQAWSADEDARLLAYFGRGTSIEVMADLHQRTTGAIRARLVKLGQLKVTN